MRSSGPDHFALIIGAQRSATTSLFHLLGQHPAIAACREKEPQFFSDDARFARGFGWYQGLWDWDPARHLVALEASIHYTTLPYRPGVPERLMQAGAERFRLIYLIRNPLDRIESHAIHGARDGRAEPVDQGISEPMLEYSRYAAQLAPYAALGRERIRVVLTEDLAETPDRLLSELCDFLGVEPEFRFQGVDVRHNTRHEYALEHPAVASLRRFGPLRRALARVVPAALQYRIRQVLGGQVSPGLRERFVLSAEQRRDVIRQLTPDLCRLRDEWGVDVEGRWGLTLPPPAASSASDAARST